MYQNETNTEQKGGRMKKNVLFICTHNSARSQMAEGLLNHLYGNRYNAFSAGTEKSAVNPYAISAMKKIGIDISSHRSKSIEEFRGHVFDIVVTVCDGARESCPFFPGRKVMHKSFRDPSYTQGSSAHNLNVFEQVRDEIRDWIQSTFCDSGPSLQN
jgi:arsenate reductase